MARAGKMRGPICFCLGKRKDAGLPDQNRRDPTNPGKARRYN
jgi:hypothetical protein